MEKEPSDSSSALPLEIREEYRRRLMSVWEHTQMVRASAVKLATRLIDNAETENDLDLARRLLQRCSMHDLSKFQGIEWDTLHRDEDQKALRLAIHQHQQTNDHHPEYHVDGISAMNDAQIAEMVCDWHARQSEMGTDFRSFIKVAAPKRWGFTTKSKVYRTIKRFVDLLLDPVFK